jgi:hypothetical protein
MPRRFWQLRRRHPQRCLLTLSGSHRHPLILRPGPSARPAAWPRAVTSTRRRCSTAARCWSPEASGTAAITPARSPTFGWFRRLERLARQRAEAGEPPPGSFRFPCWVSFRASFFAALSSRRSRCLSSRNRFISLACSFFIRAYRRGRGRGGRYPITKGEGEAFSTTSLKPFALTSALIPPPVSPCHHAAPSVTYLSHGAPS